MNRVAGKVAIVTGAGSGLGKCDAELLAAEGANVVVTDIDEKAAGEVADAINSRKGGRALALTLDVRDEDRWQAVVDATEKEFGRVSTLVNNAGVVIVATPETTTLEQFRFANAVMNEGVFLGMKAVIPSMKAGGSGSIINMSSIASHLGYPVFFAYSAAKGAVRSMTKSVAVHCQMNGYGIRVNSIHAGAIETPMVSQANAALGVSQEEARAALGQTGIGSVEDIGWLVVYLASDESRFVNGAELLVDNALSVQ